MCLIMIDPGHGGNDPGAAACGLREKDLNLAIGLELAELVWESGRSALLTRSGDLSLSLEQRCEMANKSRADRFLSVHCNASQNPGAGGIELFHAADSDAGRELALALHGELRKLGRKDRGVKPSGYYVLKHTAMPACLVECGFITNPGEADWMKTHVREIARAMAQGIAELLT